MFYRPFSACMILLFMLLGSSADAAIINVPADYSTVQLAMDEAASGDTVLIAPGQYVENVNFYDKNLVLASHFLLSGDPADIVATILDGSEPTLEDTTSTILMPGGQDQSSQVVGLTIIGGQGTLVGVWGAREGGGLLMDNASPIVRWNVFRDNHVIGVDGGDFAGGGGLSVFYGDPLIEHNVIVNNTAPYGGGAVTNWSNGILRNNLIANNYCDGPNGAGGLMIYGDSNDDVRVENCSVLANASVGSGRGGGLVAWTCVTSLHNSLFHGNYTPSVDQEYRLRYNGSINASFTLMPVDLPGLGNMNDTPVFADLATLVLDAASPGVDAGDFDAAYNDPEDPDNAGQALYPARGGVRADMGGYGGPNAADLPPFDLQVLRSDQDDLQLSADDIGNTVVWTFTSGSAIPLTLSDVQVELTGGDGLTVDADFPITLNWGETANVTVQWDPSTTDDLAAELTVTHDHGYADAPVFAISGTQGTAVRHRPDESLPSEFQLHAAYPNPFNPTTSVAVSLPRSADLTVTVYDRLGRTVRELANGSAAAGTQTLVFDGSSLASGIYFVRAVVPGQLDDMQKVVLMK